MSESTQVECGGVHVRFNLNLYFLPLSRKLLPSNHEQKPKVNNIILLIPKRCRFKETVKMVR